MKFSIALFAAGALAQVSVLQNAISEIQSGTEALGSAVSAFSGIADAGTLQQASQGVIDTINDQTEAVNAAEDVPFNDAINLAGPLGNLADAVEAAVDATIAKKPDFVAASVGVVVLSQLQSLQTAAQTFTAAAKSKIPAELQTTADQLAAPINAALARAIEEYSDQTGGSPSGSATVTTPAPSASATDGPAPSGSATETTEAPSSTTSGPIETFTGAAVANAAGFGAVAMAAMAAVAAL